MKKSALFMLLLMVASLGVSATQPQISPTAIQDQPVLIDARPVRNYDLGEKFEMPKTE